MKIAKDLNDQLNSLSRLSPWTTCFRQLFEHSEEDQVGIYMAKIGEHCAFQSFSLISNFEQL